MQTLGGRHETLVTRERSLLESLLEFLTGLGAPTGGVELLRRTLTDTEDPFLLVVGGESNAGRTTPYNNFVQSELNRMKMAESILGKLGSGATATRGAVDSPSL